MVTTRPPKTIVKPTALGPVANTDTKLLIYGLFQKGRVLAQDGRYRATLTPRPTWAVFILHSPVKHRICPILQRRVSFVYVHALALEACGYKALPRSIARRVEH